MSFTTLPTVETFGNNDITTLAASMGVPDTILLAVSIVGFPVDGQFRLLIDAELLLVTGYDSGSNRWQVVRGIENTTAATHSDGAQVVCILTRGGLLKLKSDAQATGGNVFVYREGEPDPTGSVYATFDAAYQAAFATGVPSTIVVDDSLGDGTIVPPINGTAATISAFDGTLATITGLSGMTSEMVGQSITFWLSANSTNNGSFVIAAFISDSSVQITNASAVFPDGNSGSINWGLNVDYNLSGITLSAPTPGVYEEPTTLINVGDGVTFNEGIARITGGLWLTCGFNVQPFLGTLSGASSYFMRIDSGSLLASDTSGTFDLSQGNNPQFFLELADGGQVQSSGGCQPFAFTGEGSPTVNLQVGDACYIDEGFISGTGGNFNLRVNSLSAVLPTNFDFGGGVSVVFGALASNLEPFAGSGSFPTPGVAPNITAGTMYYDEGTSQPYWWNGSSWVTYPSPVPHIFIYAAGSSPSGNIYNTFDAAYAAAVAGGLPALIGIDNRLGACTITTNTNFDLSQITLTGGFGPNTNLLTVQAGTWNQGFAKITNNLNVVVSLATSTTALITITGPTYSQNAYVENTSSITIGTQGRIWDLSTGGGFNLDLYIGDDCTVSGNGSNGQAVWIGSVGSTSIYLRGAPTCTLPNDAIGGSERASIYIGVGAVCSGTFPFFSGSLTLTYQSLASNLAPYTGSGAFPTTPNVAVGSMYFDQTSGQPYWWNGGGWIPANPAPVRSTIFGYTNNQTTHLSAGDHVTFSTVDFNQGSDITLDTSSPYSTTLGQASIGRITLEANHSYKLVGSVVEAEGTGSFFTQWANASVGALLGIGTRLQAPSGDNDVPGQAVAFVTVDETPILVELQITHNGGITGIGENGTSPLYPWCTVEEIA